MGLDPSPTSVERSGSPSARARARSARRATLLRYTAPRSVSRVLIRLRGCVPSLAASDRLLLRARAGVGGPPRSLTTLAHRLDATPVAVLGRLGRSLLRLTTLADTTACARGAVATGVGASRAIAASASAETTAASDDGATEAAAGSLQAIAVPADQGPLGRLVDDPAPAVWVLAPLLVLLLVTGAVLGHELRRATSIGGTLPPSRLARWWRAARGRGPDHSDRR
jgi:hypothetical protein